MTHEVMPHLSRRDTATYRDALLARFANPALQHRGDMVATAKVLLGIGAIWGSELPHDALWAARVTHWLECIQSCGVLPAIRELNRNAAPVPA